MKEKYARDPLDPALLYEKFSWTNERVFAHKLIKRKPATGGQPTVLLKEDSYDIKKDGTEEVLLDFGANPILCTHESGKQEVHSHTRRDPRHNYNVRHSGQTFTINAVFVYPEADSV